MTTRRTQLKARSRIRLVGAVALPLILGISLLSFSHAREGSTAAAMFPESENTFDFTNNEAEDAHDLHIKWSRAVQVKSSDPFKKVNGSGKSSTDFSNGTVKKGGGKASIKVSWDGTDPEVKEWWWTKADGSRLGEVKTGNPTTARSPATSAIRNGLQIVTFDTLQGRVIVNLPDDMRAGDTISGTVMAEPKGQTPEERAKNQTELNGYVIELEMPRKADRNSVTATVTGVTPVVYIETAVTAAPSQITFTLPPSTPTPTLTNVSSANSGGLGITLTNTSGSFAVGGTTTVPIELVHLSLQSVAPLTLPQLPSIGQQGRPIVITGPFDGNSSNTQLNWTRPRSAVQDFEKNTENVSGGFGLIAESPRKAVFTAPSNQTGPAEIILKEGNTETKGTFRNVGVNLSAPKTNLLKGESTTLKIEVQGLQGITQPIPLHLTNGGAVTMTGGNSQTMSIKPSDVQGNGTFTTTRSITGVRTGAWDATATVVTFDTCLEDDGDPLRVLLFNVATGDFVFCQGRGESTGEKPISISTFPFGNDFSGGVRVQAGDGIDSAVKPGAISIGPGASITKNGTFTSADFNYTQAQIHVELNEYTHSGSAMVQTSNPKKTFTITDRDTRNNTCACK